MAGDDLARYRSAQVLRCAPSTGPVAPQDERGKDGRSRRRYVRFTRWRRAHFFRVLEETGHAQLAAEAAGVSHHCIYRLRRLEAGFAERMDAARAKADAGLRGAGGEEAGAGSSVAPSPSRPASPDGVPLPRGGEGKLDAERGSSFAPSPRPSPPRGRGGVRRGGEGLFVIRRGIGGRLRVMAAGKRWWTDRHDSLFLAHLRVTGNASASARAAGFTAQSARNRRKRRPDFARAAAAALEEAQSRLESELIVEAKRRLGAYALDPVLEADVEAAEASAGFDPWLAMWLLRRWERLQEKEARRTP